MNRRILSQVTMGLREFRRTPVLVAILLMAPAYFIGLFLLLVPEMDVSLRLVETTVSAPASGYAATFMTAVAIATVSGNIGLFLMLTSEATDSRLRLAGYSDVELIVARLGTLGAGVAVATASGVGTAIQVFQPEQFVAFTVMTALLGITYGLIGFIAGMFFERLAGVYVMLIVPLAGVLLFQNPLASNVPGWSKLIPGHYTTAAMFETAFTASLDLWTVLSAIGYVAVLTALSVRLFQQTMEVDS